MTDRTIKLLFVAANPNNTQAIDISGEQRAISEAIRKSLHGANIQIVTELAVRSGELGNLLDHHKPDIVHFSGHGLTSGAMAFEDETRQLQPVTIAAFADLISTRRGNIRLVVLNACWSGTLAQQLAAENCIAVGMGRAIDDVSASAFAAEFYAALGYGYTVSEALQVGQNAINMRNLPDAAVPQIALPQNAEPLRFFMPDPVCEWERANPPTEQKTVEWGEENDPIRLLDDPERVPLTDDIVQALYAQYTASTIREESVISSGLSGASVRLVSLGMRSAYAKIGQRREVEREWWIHKQVRTTTLSPHVPEVLCDPLGPVEGWSLILYAPAGQGILSVVALSRIMAESVRATNRQVEQLLKNVLADWSPPTFTSEAQAPQALLQKMLDLGKRRTADLHERMMKFGFVGKYHPLLNFRPGPRGRQLILPNPIAYVLDEKLWGGNKADKVKPLFGPIHGDLHADNVICRLQRDGWPDAKEPPSLIDFAQSTSQGSAFYDLAYLELDLLLREIPLTNRDNWDNWVVLCQYLTSNVTPDENGLPRNKLIEQAWEMISPIREQVRTLIDALSSTATDGAMIAEWNWWLAAIAAGVMVARRTNDANGQRLAGLFYAATALDTLLSAQQLDVPIPDECEPYVTTWGKRKTDPTAVPPALPADLSELIGPYLEGIFREKREDLVNARQWWTDLTGDLRPHIERAHRGTDDHWLDAMLRKDPMTGDHWTRTEALDTAKPAAVPNVTRQLMSLTRVVLLAEPGAGKTVTLKKLTVAYIDAHLEAHDPTRPLPVFVPLAKFDGKTTFAEFAGSYLYNLAEYAPQLNLVWLFDALNEMPRRGKLTGATAERDLLPEVIAFLQGLAAQGERGRFVLSCRVKDYRDELGAIQDIDKVELRDLTPYQIQAIVNARLDAQTAPKLWAALKGSDDLLAVWTWFVEFEKEFWINPNGSYIDSAQVVRTYLERADLAPDKRAKLLGDLEQDKLYYWEMPTDYQNGREARAALHTDPRRLMLMCRNPFTLNVVLRMVELNGIDDLPNNRGVLFQKFAAAMLRYELTKQAEVEHISGQDWIEGMERRVGVALEKVAAALQRVEQRTELSRAAALRAVDAPDAETLLRTAEAARLIQYGETVRFTHQLLQEYFATAELRDAMSKGDPAARFFGNTWWEAGAWRETVVILGELMGKPNDVAQWLAPATPDIALSVILDNGDGLTLADVTPETRDALITSANARATEPDPRGRAAAYRILGQFKADDRPGVIDFNFGADYWCDVPDSEFIMGSKRDTDNPVRTVTLSAFRIAKYPITYAQFQVFIDAPNGYANPDWWKDLHEDGLAQQRGGPAEQRFKFWNHPRERVSWYDAMAFCAWLSAKLGYEITLPTEEQWEKAARGTDGREYPYPGGFDASKGNMNETGIGQTSAVGIFPNGASPYGALDMSGNVFGWTLTEYKTHFGNNKTNNLARALRGGSWGNHQALARSAYRSSSDPAERSVSLGFRVALPFRPF